MRTAKEVIGKARTGQHFSSGNFVWVLQISPFELRKNAFMLVPVTKATPELNAWVLEIACIPKLKRVLIRDCPSVKSQFVTETFAVGTKPPDEYTYPIEQWQNVISKPPSFGKKQALEKMFSTYGVTFESCSSYVNQMEPSRERSFLYLFLIGGLSASEISSRLNNKQSPFSPLGPRAIQLIIATVFKKVKLTA